MKILSIRQPWAALVAMGTKTVENRSWRTAYRGPLLIHASLHKPSREVLDNLRLMWPELPDELPRGGIVGVATLVDVTQDSDSAWAEEGAHHWVLADPRPLPFLPWKGRLGITEADPRWECYRCGAEMQWNDIWTVGDDACCSSQSTTGGEESANHRRRQR